MNFFHILKIFILSYTFQSAFCSDNPVIIQPLKEIMKEDLLKKLKNEIDELEQFHAKLIIQQEALRDKKDNWTKLSMNVKFEPDFELQKMGIISLSVKINEQTVYDKLNLLSLEKNSEINLFNGVFSSGDYKIFLSTVLGKQIYEWPYIFPEGNRWTVDKEYLLSLDSSNQKEIKIDFDFKRKNYINKPDVDIVLFSQNSEISEYKKKYQSCNSIKKENAEIK